MTNEELIKENQKLMGLLWFAWYEFNTIRAATGAPSNISHKYWDFCTESFAEALGEDNLTPWMSEDAKKIYNGHRGGF